MKIDVTTEDAEQTAVFAGVLARKLRGGEIIELVGDVGAGKTTFVKGLVGALESDEPVSSPTFSISNVYDAGRFPVYHFDFYRLNNNDEMIRHELAETVEHDDGIIVLEWAQPLRSVLQKTPITIQITPQEGEVRKFTLSIPKEYEYIGAA